MSEARKTFEDSVTPLPDQPGAVQHGMMVNAIAPHHGAEEMTVLFSLSIPQDAYSQLEERVARGEVVPFDELTKTYAPDRKDVEALTSWLQQQGFKIEQKSAAGTGIYARATVDQIAKSLAVNMVRVTKDGLTYTAAANAPSLPADVGRSVHAIIGLQPFRKAHKHSRMRRPKHGNRSSLGKGEERQPPNTRNLTGRARSPGATNAPDVGGPTPNIANAPPYLVQEVLRAYDADGLGVTGEGQTIAILIDTFPADSDLQAFWSRNGINATLQRIEKINVTGGPLPVAEGEETLDAEWASGVAPGASVRIYASGSLAFVDLDREWDPGRQYVYNCSLGVADKLVPDPSRRCQRDPNRLSELFLNTLFDPSYSVKLDHVSNSKNYLPRVEIRPQMSAGYASTSSRPR